MLNRTIAPAFKPIKNLSLVKPDQISYANGLQCFIFNTADLDLIRIEFIFKNVYEESKSPLLNTVLSGMLKEGTTMLTSAEIANKIDFYGAYLMPEYSFDHTSLTLYTMRKYVDQVLPIVSSVLKDSIFPKRELNTYIRNNKQNLQVALQKNDVVARRMLYNGLFGNTRYGTLPTEDLYDAICREDILALYTKQIQPSNCTVMIAGNVEADLLKSFAEYFSDSWSPSEISVADNGLDFADVKPDFLLEHKEEALQSAIRLGSIAVNRVHEDYPALQFVNTLFGGFFSSRLMRNIREEKGYTYSIGSAIGSLQYAGFLSIVSEVGIDVTKETLIEIEKEMNILCQEKSSVEDVDLVRNYMQGVLLGSLESIFSHVDKFKTSYFSNLSTDYYDYYADVIAEMTPDKVQDIAIKYFNYDNLLKVVVGKT